MKKAQIVEGRDAKDFDSVQCFGSGFLKTRIKLPKKEQLRRITQGKKGR